MKYDKNSIPPTNMCSTVCSIVLSNDRKKIMIIIEE